MSEQATEATQTDKSAGGESLRESTPLYSDMGPGSGDTDAKSADAEAKPADNAPEVKPDQGDTTIAPVEGEAAPDKAAEESKSGEKPTIEPILEGDGQQGGKQGEEKAAEGSETTDIQYGEFKLPEGQAMDQEALDKLIPLAKEAKLNQETVQGVIDIAADMIARQQQAQEYAIETQETAWKKEIVSDPEIGGAKQVEAASMGERALNRFDDGGLKEVLEVGRLKYNPAVRRFLARVGAAVSEDAYVGGRPATKASAAKSLYGDDHVV